MEFAISHNRFKWNNPQYYPFLPVLADTTAMILIFHPKTLYLLMCIVILNLVWGIIKFNHRPTPTATALTTTGIKERREHDKWQWYHSYTKIKKKRHENVFLCFLCKYFSLISQRAATVTVDIAYDILIRCLRNMNQLKFLHKAENIWRPKLWQRQKGMWNNLNTTILWIE